jgi:hypothetical protein
MTGAELVAHLASDCGQPQDVIRDLLQALADAVESELRAGQSATIPGLGAIHVFETTDKARPVKLSWYTEDGMRKRITEYLTSRRTVRAARPIGERPPWAQSVPAVAGPLSGTARGRAASRDPRRKRKAA